MSALPTPVQLSLGCWFVLEIGLLVRDLVRRQVGLRQDRGTRAIVTVSLVGAIVFGWLVRGWVPVLGVPAPRVFLVAGLVVFWIGLVVRIWAVLTLGRSFSTFIQVDQDQAVVTRGPYRWVRHPSYSGVLLICLGFGLGTGNWLSLLICALVPTAGLLPRIAVEESELARRLGEPYRRYQHTTRRLVPGLW
jgi:protein-S-isoprenylcysteine O-methyltransferase Ste14